MGRLGSFAGLVYSGDTSDPARAKFYGDLRDRLTTISTQLLFFTLELNRLDDAALERALQNPALAVYRPWLEDLRLEKPYQLDDTVERLFHEKSVTGRGAWNRLFDETLAALRFDVEGETLTLEPTLNRLVDPSEARRKSAAEALARLSESIQRYPGPNGSPRPSRSTTPARFRSGRRSPSRHRVSRRSSTPW